MLAPILLAAYIVGIDPRVLESICMVESGLDASAISLYDGRTHSYGLCQIKLSTAKELGFTGTSDELFNPYTNAKYAALYFRHQLTRYKETKKAIIAYNRGGYQDGVSEKYFEKVVKASRQVHGSFK